MTDVLLFMTGEVLCGHVGVTFFCGGYVECHFYRHSIPYFYLYQFLFFLGEISTSHLFL